ncbi:MAG: hypothetical protein OZ928_14925, partial [Polyangiaceae bacterium]|nr:hypothetical protein [Polyangiaceae bacterium]
MTPLDPDGGASPASVAPPAGGAAPRRRTLPPPEWERGDGPRSAASLALARHEGEKPVSRRVGPRAEQAWLEAQVRAASASGDAEAEREASAALARLLAARGTELDTATKLARRALLLGEDAALRDELSTWLAALGEAALAAATLRPLIAPAPGSEAAKTLVRSAVLLCRAGAVAEAVAALDDAAKRDEADPTALELLGAIGGWAPEAVDAARAAGAYLDAAARREAMGDRAAAFEDLLRATEADPSHDGASRALARVLRSRGRGGAADVVLYLHARAGGARRAELHGARLRAAAERGDLAGAVTAGLDAALEAAEGSSDALAFDALLERAGLAELLAARIDVDCDGLIGSELARRRMELARLYAGPLASPERASRVWLEALVADPSSQAARAALREHATSLRDQTPLVEALIRVGLGEGSAVEERIQCLRELAVLAEQRLGDPALAAWAVRRIGTLGWLDDELASTAKRLAPRVRLQDEALAAAREALLASTAGDRPDALRRVAGILRGRPDAVEEYLATLVELVSLAPAERTWQVALERVLERTGRFDELEALLGRLAGQARSRTDEERVRAALAALRRRRGDWAGAFRELSPLLEGGGAHSSAWCMGMVLAARLGDGASRARALLRIASTLAPALRAALTGVAADALLEAGELVAARAAAEQASHVDPALARPVATLAAIALVAQDASSPRALERAMGVIVPRAELCRALADSYEGAGEGALAIVWTQRWLTLTPGAPAAAHALLRRVLAAGDPARVADALGWLLSQPRSQADVSPMLSSALPKLARVDSARASALARRALDVIGPVDDVLRATLLLVAEELGEPGLGIAVLERWLAAGTADTDHAAILLELAERRRRAGDADGAARARTRARGVG